MILKELKIRVPNMNLVTNCYIVADEKTNEAMVIDPGCDEKQILNMLDIMGVNVKYIVLTHCHFDHITKAETIKSLKGGKILVSRDDYDGLMDSYINLSEEFVGEKVSINADSRLDDGDEIHVGDLNFEILLTPGHTKGGICLYNKENKLIFTGDTIFAGSYGRCDLPTSSQDIIKSIKSKILVLPDDVIIYPGHGKPSMVGDEKLMYMESE